MSHPYENEKDVVVADDRLNANMDADILADAKAADDKEHKMTAREGWRTHKKAILWSMALSGALIMEGYDVVVIGSFYGHPAFLKRFGHYQKGANNGIDYYIPAEWQSALSNGSSAGGIIGLLVNGWAADRFGPKLVMMVSTVALTGFIFIMVFAESLSMLVIAEVFCGIPWGVFQTLTTAYASEVCPIQLRGYLTAYVNACWGMGILLSSGVVKSTTTWDSDNNWAWRLPFVLQWIWVIPLFLIVFFSPQSPWWLVRQNRLEEAEQSLARLTNPEYVKPQDLKNTVAMMVHTNEMEKQLEEGTTYLQCFKGIDRRRTEVTCMVFAMQLLSGQNLVGQGIQFLTAAGLKTEAAFSLNMVLNSMFIIGTMASWVIMTFFGRRTVYTAGMALMSAVLLVIGGLGFFSKDKVSEDPVVYSHKYQQVSSAIGGLLIMLNFVYNASLGPMCYTLIGEISSTRLRQKSIALSRISYQIMNITCGIIVPRMLGETSWNWGAKSGLFWGGSAFLCTVYCYFRLPETRNRSYGELDLLFEHRVPAWKFSGTKVDQFSSSGNVHAEEKKESTDHIEQH